MRGASEIQTKVFFDSIIGVHMPNERSFEVKYRRGSNSGTRPSDKSLQVGLSTVLHM